MTTGQTPSETPFTKPDAAPLKEVGRTRADIERKLFAAAGGNADLANALAALVDLKIIGAMVTQTFQSQKDNRFCFLNKEGAFTTFTEAKVWPNLVKTFGNPFPMEEVRAATENNTPDAKVADEIAKAASAAVRAGVLEEISLYRQRLTIAWEVDMFADEPHVHLTELEAQITLTHRPWRTGPYDKQVIDDFRDHFPEVDDLMKFIVAARFASDRKKAYLWWCASSDFGKGLLASLLEEVGALVPISVNQVEQIMDGKAVGVSPEEFRRAIVLHIDEWQTVRSELKLLQSRMEISAKYQMRQRVPLYTKLFTSADDVPSLTTGHGVEDQFANRMSLISSEGNITERDLLRSIGKAAYAKSLKNWMAEQLNTHTKTYITRGPEMAAMMADQAVDEFHADHGIGNTHGRLGDKLQEVADSFRADMLAPRLEFEGWKWQIDQIKTARKDAGTIRDQRLAELRNAGQHAEADALEKRPLLSPEMMEQRTFLARKIDQFKDVTEEGFNGKVILPKAKARFDQWVNQTIPHSERKTIQARAREIIALADVGAGKPATHKLRWNKPPAWGILLRGEDE